jgi:PAS domain S-box-containing protein
MAFADDGTLTAVNRTLLTTLGFAREELVGRSVETILPVGSRIFYQTHLFPLVRLHGAASEIFLLLRAKDGDDVAVLMNAARRERDGTPVTECILIQVRERRKFEDALLLAKKDAETARAAADERRREVENANTQLRLTQRQLQEQAEELEMQAEELHVLNDDLVRRTDELERLRVVAEEATRAKSAFLAVMSHELRTPLNAIGGYVQLLEMGIQGPVNTAQADALAKVARSQRHLLRLINDILNLARVEAGRLDYDIQRVVLRDVVDAMLPMVEPQLATRHLRFEVDVPSELAVLGDRERIEQILLNLLSNAIKFTAPDGQVSVSAHDGSSGDDGRVHLLVRDTGTGIAPERLAQVFEPFVQVDVSHTRRAQGTGLGLTISRDLARGMGGDLIVESEKGVGSTFTLTLPKG